MSNEAASTSRVDHAHDMQTTGDAVAGPSSELGGFDRADDIDTAAELERESRRTINDRLDDSPPDIIKGWENPDNTPEEVVQGLDNEELWKLIRRFDKQTVRVKACRDNPTHRGLYPEEEFDLISVTSKELTPDRLRNVAERLYMTVFIGLMSFLKNLARLRSWNEYRRTATCCAVYFAACAIGQVGILLVGTTIVCMLCEPARHRLFPPAPLSKISTSSGGLQRPKAGFHAGSRDINSLTGAAEAQRGEAVEQEARRFISSLAFLASAAAADQASNASQPGIGNALRKVSNILPGHPKHGNPSGSNGESREDEEGSKNGGSVEDVPVDVAVQKGLGPILLLLEDLCDNYERFCNALNPTAPFPMWEHKLRLAALILPIGLGTAFIKAQYFVRACTFLFGVIFFSQPYLTIGWRWLNRNYPEWPQYLVLQHNILRDIPSDQQLTLTLLRLAERNDVPLPPPPMYPEYPPERDDSSEPEENLPPVNEETADYDLAVDNDFEEEFTHDKDSTFAEERLNRPHPVETKRMKIRNFLKTQAKTGITSMMGADKVKAAVGSPAAQVQQAEIKKRIATDGPGKFRSRFNGKKGWFIITPEGDKTFLSWERARKVASEHSKDSWTHDIDDITEMHKHGGLGWKSKVVVDKMLGMEVVDALSLKTTGDETITISALPRRDEAFNRILALSKNRWESH